MNPDQFDFFAPIPEAKPTPDMDPLCQLLWGMTEKEFFAMFEEPSGPYDPE